MRTDELTADTEENALPENPTTAGTEPETSARPPIREAGRSGARSPRPANGRAKKRPHVPRNPLTRALALVAALVIVAGLGIVVDRQVGNPLSAWYTTRKIAAHYREYHPGQGYVVGPAQYSYVQDTATGCIEPGYVCRVYKTGSVDTGFAACFKDGAVLETERASVFSGVNTYNRFKANLCRELDEANIRKAAGITGYDEVFADFYEPDAQRDVFDPAAPVFVPDSTYDRAHLPLETVVCAFRTLSEDKLGADGTQALADCLMQLKTACDGASLPFDRYSMQLCDAEGKSWYYAMDVPAQALATEKDALAYVRALPEAERLMQPDAFWKNTMANRKSDWLGRCTFEVCAH